MQKQRNIFSFRCLTSLQKLVNRFIKCHHCVGYVNSTEVETWHNTLCGSHAVIATVHPSPPIAPPYPVLYMIHVINPPTVGITVNSRKHFDQKLGNLLHGYLQFCTSLSAHIEPLKETCGKCWLYY